MEVRGDPGVWGGATDVLMQGQTLRTSHSCIITLNTHTTPASSKAASLRPSLDTFVLMKHPHVLCVFLLNRTLVVKIFLINCHNYCDLLCPNEQPDGRIWCHICDPIVLIWLRVHLSTLCHLLCSQSVPKFLFFFVALLRVFIWLY